MCRVMGALILFAIALIPVGVRAQSQATTGVIEGTVSDETGGRLPGATVTLVNTGTNFTRGVATDADGRFRALLLPLGVYKITVSLQGFGTYTQDGTRLVAGQTANLPVTPRISRAQ